MGVFNLGRQARISLIEADFEIWKIRTCRKRAPIFKGRAIDLKFAIEAGKMPLEFWQPLLDWAKSAIWDMSEDARES